MLDIILQSKKSKMEKPYSVKYLKKEKSLELVIEPFVFDDIVDLFGKKQLMTIETFCLFQNEEDLSSDYDFNEDSFSDMDITLEFFSVFLKSIGKYEIHCFVFEIEDGTQFSIEEERVKILIKQEEQKTFEKLFSLFSSSDDIISLQKLLNNQGRYIYFNKTPETLLISNNELWNKFACSVN
jgi:hypothetical protein